MKIIFTVYTYHPLKDGVQAVTQYLAEGLSERGHDVTVVTKTEANCKDEEIYNGVRIIRANVFTRHAIHRGDKYLYQKLILELTKDADVLVNVCTQIVTTDWIFEILDKIKCVKFLYMHGMIDFKIRKFHFKSLISLGKKIWNNVRWGIYYKMALKYFRKYDIISHLHYFDDAYMFFKKHKIDNCIILENAAEDQFFQESFQPIEELPDRYIICVANYSEIKNQEFCLEAFFKAKTKDYGMIFIGSDKNIYFNKLINLKNKLENIYGKKDVKFLTGIPRNLISSYVKNSKIYVMGSKREAFPISIIEAMASGIPFISSNVGCVRFLPGGIIINTLDEMIYWIEMLINNPTLAKKMGQIGNLYAKDNFKIKSKIDKFEGLLLKLINDRS